MLVNKVMLKRLHLGGKWSLSGIVAQSYSDKLKSSRLLLTTAGDYMAEILAWSYYTKNPQEVSQRGIFDVELCTIQK